jgi:hypothetical protein
MTCTGCGEQIAPDEPCIIETRNEGDFNASFTGGMWHIRQDCLAVVYDRAMNKGRD